MQIENPRVYGKSPFSFAVIHGGPGAAGEMAPVAQTLSRRVGVLEPLQSKASLEGQLQELRGILERRADLPATLLGYSWGAWLSFLLTARFPALVKKLVLVASPPFTETFAAQITAVRLARLTSSEGIEYRTILDSFTDALADEKDRLLSRLGELTAKSDSYSRSAPTESNRLPRSNQGAIFQNVWQEAAALRRSGALIELARSITVPVTAIHGDFDPHPVDGVRLPLREILPDFRLIVLSRCGHTPWEEQYARDAFFQALEREVSI